MNKNLKHWLWLSFEVLVPVLFVISIWPISHHIIGLEHPFERALSSADLLPLGALILIGIIIEVSFDEKINNNNFLFSPIMVLGCVMALLLLFVYGFMKAESFSFDISKIGTPEDDGRMSLFSDISLLSITASCIYAILIKLYGIIFEN